MKSQIVILILFSIGISAGGQGKLTTSTPCTDSMAQNTEGRWIKSTDLGSMNSKETNSRLEEVQNTILNVYSKLVGVDAVWHRAAGVSYYGSKRKYYNKDDGTVTFDYSNLPHFIQFSYTAGFFRYQCEYNKTHSLLAGYPGETGTWLNIIANPSLGDLAADDAWTINGLPVIMRRPVFKSEEGIEFLYTDPESSSGSVLIYRKGALPYTPVSRKQYLDYCIIYHTRLWDDLIKGTEQTPVRPVEEQENEKKAKLAKFEKDLGKDPKRLKSAVDYYLSGYKTDQQIRDENITKAKKNKEQELKKFADELGKTTARGLLNSPAMILVKYYSNPIFETDPLKGMMLLTENPDYIRKNLPKHVPQIFIVAWSCNDWIPQKRVGEIMEQDFPFEKLQAMIDK